MTDEARPIVVGTAGWTYGGFRGGLREYAGRFDGVEVDSSFYAIPAIRVVARWAQLTPAQFTFDVKLHRLLSRHAATLSSVPSDLRARAQVAESGRVVLDAALEQTLCGRTLEATEPLRAAGKLNSLLLQLTPAFRPPEHGLNELETLIDCLKPVPVAIELRHRKWLRDLEATLDWFRRVRAAFVSVDTPTSGRRTCCQGRMSSLATTSRICERTATTPRGTCGDERPASASTGATRRTSCARSPAGPDRSARKPPGSG